MMKKLPNIAINFSNLHPLKYEQHWRENIVDILHGMRRYVSKQDADIGEVEYLELLRSEHLLKDLYPVKYIALKRSRVEATLDTPHPNKHLTGVLFHIIQNARDTSLNYKIPAAINELVSLKRSKEVLEELQCIQNDDTAQAEDKSLLARNEPIDDVAVTAELEKPLASKAKHSKDKDWTMVPYDDYMKLKYTVEVQRKKIAEMTHRLSHFPGRELSDETMFISDTDDDSRPTRLAERFANLYGTEWTNALEGLVKNLRWREIDSIFQLLRIIRYAYDYCETAARDQLKQLETVLSGPMLHPKGNYHSNSPEEIEFQKLPEDQREILSLSGLRCVKEYRKFAAPVSIPELCEEFKQQVFRHTFKWDPDQLPISVLCFSEKCVELLWLMCIQEPPMVITWATDGETINEDYYNFYIRKGTTVRQAVWPAVFLHNGGPLLKKGVVLPV